ncbi:hypothetical protein FB567DRAFT_417270, partial [Paraphoma chrysanthemicola]
VRLVQLLVSLPEKSLQSFKSDREIDSSTLGLMIKRQPNIRELSARVPGPAPIAVYVAGNLRYLRSLELLASADLKGYDAWLQHTEALTSLQI